MSHRLMAILEFDAGALREFLQLPETAEIVDVRMGFERRGRIQFKIEGAGYPTQEGELIPAVTCIIGVRRGEDGDIDVNPTLNWPFDPVLGVQEEQP
jgi:hypothetical protein